jgi:uncharacterized protein
MRTLFADTFYWVALINPGDDWYSRVLSISQSLGQIRLVTTDEVLTEKRSKFEPACFLKSI